MSRRSTPFAKRFGSVADGLARNPENKRATQRVQDERKGTSVHVGAPFEATPEVLAAHIRPMLNGQHPGRAGCAS
jgi:hypothetical protein